VPEGYFDSLAENIMGRIESNNKNTRPFVRSIISSRSFKLAAASLLILVSIGIIYVLSDGPDTAYTNIDMLAWDDIVDEDNYLLIEFDESILMESYLAEIEIENELSLDLSSEDIINYLIEENDLEDIVYDI